MSASQGSNESDVETKIEIKLQPLQDEMKYFKSEMKDFKSEMRDNQSEMRSEMNDKFQL
jgi:hypothetical protein